MKNTPCILAFLAATVLSSQAAVVFSENFGSTTLSTTTNFTVQQTWNYSDSVNTTVGANESRLFNPNGVGSGFNTHGWISALTSGNTFQQIQSGGTFSGLPTLEIGESYLITLSWVAGSESSIVANDVNAYVNFTSAGNALAFAAGSNGTPGQVHFSSQTLSDSNAAADAIGMNFVAQAGPGGYDPARAYTATFTTTADLNGDAFSLVLGRGTNLGGGAFVFYDNVSVDVSVVPEPGAVLLGSIGLLALMRRRRA